MGVISEDASDLLNSMFDEEDMLAGAAVEAADGVRFEVEPGGYGLYAGAPRTDMRSSLSSALLAGMAEGGDDEGEDGYGSAPAWESPAPPVSQSSSQPQSQPTEGGDDRAQRLNAQRELERQQRQALQPVSNLDKDRKYLLFGDDDDDDI